MRISFGYVAILMVQYVLGPVAVRTDGYPMVSYSMVDIDLGQLEHGVLNKWNAMILNFNQTSIPKRLLLSCHTRPQIVIYKFVPYCEIKYYSLHYSFI